MRRATALVVGVLAIGSVAIAQGPRRDGKWEVTTEMEMAGMPMKMPPFTNIQCVTKEEANDPLKSAPKGRGGRGGEDPNCKVSDYKVTGNKVTYTVKCEGDQPTTMKGEMLYGDDTYTATQTMEVAGRGTMTMKSTAKRLGDCIK